MIDRSSVILLLPLLINYFMNRCGRDHRVVQTSRSHYGSKSPAVTITVFKYRNKIGKIVVKTVPYSVNVNVKNTL
jgi:hypothetical protein